MSILRKPGISVRPPDATAARGGNQTVTFMMRSSAAVFAMWLLTLSAAAPAVAGDGAQRAAGPVPGASQPAIAFSETSGYVVREPEFAMALAFGREAMGGIGQCSNPNDRASHRCRVRLAEGGPAVAIGGPQANPAVGVRFLFRF